MLELDVSRLAESGGRFIPATLFGLHRRRRNVGHQKALGATARAWRHTS